MGKSKPKKVYDKKFGLSGNSEHNVKREGVTPSNKK